jgi:serine/threonine-protein kinase
VSGSVGRYVVEGELARGGMGVVYRAFDPQARRRVALKTLAAEGGLDEAQLARFRAECAALARLQHPGVVRIHDAGEHQGKPYLVQELLEGRSYAERLAQAGPLPVTEAAQVALGVAEA